jgi:hypothetical protein
VLISAYHEEQWRTELVPLPGRRPVLYNRTTGEASIQEPMAAIVTLYSYTPIHLILLPGTEAVLINDGVIISSLKQLKISPSYDSVI